MEEEFNFLPELIEALQKTADEAVRKAAFDIQAAAMDNAPVGETGYLKSSIYTVTDQSSSYGQGLEAPAPGAYLLPEAELLHDGSSNALIGVGANYGVYQEMGTIYMAAQPFLGPAIEQVAPSFEEAMSRLEEKMREVTGGL